MEELYRSVRTGAEAQRTLDTCGAPDYREKLEGELDEWRTMEMWKAGATVRSLRPENWAGKKARPAPARKSAKKAAKKPAAKKKAAPKAAKKTARKKGKR